MPPSSVSGLGGWASLRIPGVAKFGNVAYSGNMSTRTPQLDVLLRRLREDRGESLRGTAEALGVAPSYLSRVERGERPITEQMRPRLARYYNVEEDLIALASGEVPGDVLEILRDHPELIARIRQEYRGGASSSAPLS